MQAISNETIIVLDFGAQYAQLIARKVRACRVYCEILPHDAPLEEILSRNPKGVIFSGGPSSVYEVEAPQCADGLFHCGRANSGHLLRPSGHGPYAGRQGHARRQARVRQNRTSSRARGRAAL